MPALPVRTCHVWWALLRAGDARPPDDEALVRAVLARYRATDPDRALHHAVARCGQRFAVAVANDPVGLHLADAAHLADPAALARDALAPAEQDVLERLPPEQRTIALLRYLTRKQAALSAYGLAGELAMRDLVVSAPDDPPQLLHAPRQMPPPVQLRDLVPGGGPTAALAVRHAQPYHVEVLAAAPLLRRDPPMPYAAAG